MLDQAKKDEIIAKAKKSVADRGLDQSVLSQVSPPCKSIVCKGSITIGFLQAAELDAQKDCWTDGQEITFYKALDKLATYKPKVTT